jgi:hypothetical protein
MLRDNSAAGVAFCRQLTQQVIQEEDGDISIATVTAFAGDLATYLANCTIAPKSKQARRVNDAAADESEAAVASKGTDAV